MEEKLTSRSDEELMVLYQNDNSSAFEILFERYSNKIFNYLLSRLKHVENAQDVLQMIFFKLHRSRDSYSSSFKFMPWLYAITKSTMLDFVKGHKINLEFEDEKTSFLISTWKAHDDSVDLVRLYDYLNHLPVDQKEALEMRYFQESSFEEVAIKLGTTPNNARQLVSRGVKKLKSRLVFRKKTPSDDELL